MSLLLKLLLKQLVLMEQMEMTEVDLMTMAHSELIDE